MSHTYFCLMMAFNSVWIVFVGLCLIADGVDVEDLHAQFTSTHSAKYTWTLDNEIAVSGLDIQLETSQADNNHRCGQGNTVELQHDPGASANYELIVWEVTSSSSLRVCIRLRVKDEWQTWRHFDFPSGAKMPPLLFDEPRAQDSTLTYRANTTATGMPAPRWHWKVNSTLFNTTSLPDELNHVHKWGISSPNKTHGHLEIKDILHVDFDLLNVQYEAQNQYGKIRSNEVIVRRPYMTPARCRGSEVDNQTISEPSGVVLECDIYEGFPDTSYHWSHCPGPCPTCYGSSCNCPKLFEIAERKFLAQNGERLVLTHASRNDTGCYICMANNALSGRLCHNTIQLNVTSDDDDRIGREGIKLIHKFVRTGDLTPSQSRIDPDGPVNVALGGTLHLECTYQTHPIKPVMWFHNESGVPIKNDARHSLSVGGDFLDIHDIIFDDEGHYHCKSSKTGKYSAVGGEFNIHVNGAPKILKLESQSGFIGENISLFCDVVFSRSIQWYKNMDTEVLATGKYELSRDKKRLTIKMADKEDTGTYSCKAIGRYGQSDTSYATVVALEPVLVHGVKAEIFSSSMNLICDASTDPNLSLEIEWEVLNCAENLTMEAKLDSPHILMISELSNDIDWPTPCHVTCTASSLSMTSCKAVTFYLLEIQKSGKLTHAQCYHPVTEALQTTSDLPGITVDTVTWSDIRLLPVTADDTTWFQQNLYVVLSLAAVGAIMLFGSIFAIARYQKKTKSRICRSRANDYASATVTFTREDRPCDRIRLVQNGQYASNAVLSGAGDNLKNQLRDVEVSRTGLHIGEMIGRGQFGRVYQGTLDVSCATDPTGKQAVAIKTLKYKSDENEMVEMFLREALMMKGFDHAHVLRLIGITFDTDCSPLVVLPFMENGDLRTYISSPDLDFRVLELLKMGTQVARGMAYLAKMKFVHRDLAARNCMVNKQGVVKVADFGLSRDIYQQEYYRTEDSKNPLPIRWMAVESLDSKIFTTKSDVWSFGVLLWELVTRGATPYPGVENWSLSRHIQQGGRMKQPLYCPNSVYELMSDCWSELPKMRPNFETLQKCLDSLTSEPVSDDPQGASQRMRRGTMEMDVKTTKITKWRTGSSGKKNLEMLNEL